MRRFIVPCLLVMSACAYAEQKAEPTPEMTVQAKKVVPLSVVQSTLNYLAEKKVGDVYNLFEALKTETETQMKANSQVKEVELDAKLIKGIQALLTKERDLQLYSALQQTKDVELKKEESKEK